MKAKQEPNPMGLPDKLRVAIESLSGIDMSDVLVHANSDRPARLNALAYAQGNQIYLGPGQERHLAHEAWHVVQQKQGRVRPTRMIQGSEINNDAELEGEADRMGNLAIKMEPILRINSSIAFLPHTLNNIIVIQAKFSQDPAAQPIQDIHHGGVKVQYERAQNTAEIHIEPGANDNGNMMQDFLMALWDASDAIAAGNIRRPGSLFMRPGGAQVLKMTMEMLGEALGQGVFLQAARTCQRARKSANTPISPNNDVLDITIVGEHLAYRNSLIGVVGINMNPIGGGTSGGTVDMLQPGASDERERYDRAIINLKPFMSLAVTMNIASIDRLIAMIKDKVGFFKYLSLYTKWFAKS